MAFDVDQADFTMMERALELARQGGERGEVPVGALVVLGGEVIAGAYNQPISRRDPSAHAEMLALRAAARVLENYRLPECTLYVTLEPCMMCAGAIVHARVKRLVYGAADPKTGACGGRFDLLEHPAHNHRTAVTAGVMAAECGALLKAFFAVRR